ncbi:MAG: hypothetical protein EXR84_13920 [Gammaproteobacteria bacterium]|nr:hypothetical protein [Gammaproteobacteria bacterium]
MWLRFYRRKGGYLLRFPNLADFAVSADGLEVTAYPTSAISAHTIEHLYLNQVFPLALSQQFKLMVHASAVEIEDFAVAFAGASGLGKSTLAASFATSGYRFLSDDGLQLERHERGYLVEPAHPSIRLWDDSFEALIPETTKTSPPVDYTLKSQFLAGDEVAYCFVTRPLIAVYFLGEGAAESVSIETVSGRDAMVELARHSLLLDIEDRNLLMHQFDQFKELTKSPMFFRLDYPRQYDMLPLVRDSVTRHSKALLQP